NYTSGADKVNQVSLDTSVAGQTTLTNSLGQKTVYKHDIIAGEFRLLEIRGAGCATCGASNQRYRYDQQGRLIETIQLNAQGQALLGNKTDFDDQGRITKISQISYNPTNGKADPAKWQVRYEYGGNNPQPSVIIRPSVVPGQEIQTRNIYNDKGQVISVTESGWSPALSKQTSATALARTTNYRYTTINGRSLLTEIDGPLPNGKTGTPIDSDITRVEWDNQGNAVTSLTAPGNFKSLIQYDPVGRIAKVVNAEGHQTSFTYNARNQLVASASDGIAQSTQYDALDRPIEIGIGEGKSYQALMHRGFDKSGLNSWSASHLGILEQNRYDTEGNLLETSTQSGNIKQTQGYAYDAVGRLIAITDTSGAQRNISWNDQDLPDMMTDALGREKHYRYDTMGNLTQVIDATNTAQAHMQNTTIRFEHDALGQINTVIAPNGATTNTVRDDFGRITAIISPDSGTVTRTYDGAGKIIASTDASGNRATYAYDVAGQLIRQTVVDANATDPAKKQTITAWQYAGTRLVGVTHPNQTERYSHDDQGRLASKTVILKLANGTLATSITRYSYDAQGLLESISLPDGSTLIYQRNGQRQVTGIQRSLIKTAWLRWLLPATPIVNNIERDLAGLKYFTYGNGIEASYQRSREGVLARIVYRHPNAKPENTTTSTTMHALLGITPAYAAEKQTTATPTTSTTPALPGALGLAADPKALIDHRYLWDVQGNMLLSQSKNALRSYAYDGQDRLIVSSTSSISQTKPSKASELSKQAVSASYERYFYDGSGNRLLAQEGITDPADTTSHTVKTAYIPNTNRWQSDNHTDEASTNSNVKQARYDASGQLEHIGQREYVWDAMGKLLEVRQENRTLASYCYNHLGERISKQAANTQTSYLYEGRKLVAELNDKGQITRQYLYLAEQAIALTDTPQGSALSQAETSPMSQMTADIATAWHAWFDTTDAIAYLHNNHLGATELVTNEHAIPLWQAEYSPYGKIIQASTLIQAAHAENKTTFAFNLRLPGQYEDIETGLYYNDHRYYDPSRGQYLTPDPLGLRGGINSYAYVANNPLKYIDPSGLILFAFDGTGNDESNSATLSNVVRFKNQYQDGQVYYITGPGTKDPTTGIENPWYKGGNKGDVAEAFTGKERIDAMLKNLRDYSDSVDDNTAFNIDITGFSRGSAEARDFANQIAAKTNSNGWYSYKDQNEKDACQKVNFRFMGLFDTVLSTHTGSYQLQIPDAFKYVVHAVALNEYRGNAVSFPSESILGKSMPSGTTRLERGFLGAHSDIGGGFPNQDLAKVAMVWMLDQANAAGVKMGSDPSINTIISNPVLHDKSSNLLSGAPDGGPTATSEDRDVRYTDGTTVKQRDATTGLMTYADTVKYITYKSNPNTSDYISGTVDAKAYLQWLNDHGYKINMTVN
ncbi:RHS repeat-associated protein, partial [Undibacterium sp. GrIS 1.8]